MKKLLAVLLALVMVLSLFAGCDNKSNKKKNNKDDDDEEDVKGTVSSMTEGTDSTGSTEGTGSTAGTENLPGGDETTGATEGTPVTPPNTADKEFDTGSVATNKYTNEFLGVTLELGSEWAFLTDAQIEERNKQALGLVGGDYKEQMKNANTFTDMAVYHSNQTDNISVVFEKLPAAYTSLTEDQYVDMSKDSLKSGLESVGLTNVVLTTGKAQFAGEEHAYIAISAKINGVPFFERMAIVKCQSYMVCITAASAQTDLTQGMLDTFKAI